MFLYTTCRDCSGLLHVTEAGQDVHPGCRPRRTRIERLTQEWLAAIESQDSARELALQAEIDEHDRQPPRLLNAALAYAARGWPVFPLRTGEKRPATRNGFKNATTDSERIRAWWTRHPDHNIGLATGHDFDVIDVDVPKGVASYMELLADTDPATSVGTLPDVHGQVATASGGIHLYIPATGDGNRAGILPGIDYRGLGGYVVAPPSTLGELGRSWSWVIKPSPTLTAARSANQVAA